MTREEALTAVRFWKLGADPEAVIYSFGKDKVISAQNFCGGRSAMSTRIGTDGHASTLEFRPAPSKSVLVVMSDLAEALLEVGKCLDHINSENPDLYLKIVAQAYMANEPLGGHIHLSYKAAKGFRANGLGAELYVGREVHKLGARLIEIYKDSTIEARNQTAYGSNGEIARVQPGGDSFARVEYRIPPTWLHTPLVAYCFLGIAKLAMLNLTKLDYLDNDIVSSVEKLVTAEHSELKHLPDALRRLSQTTFKFPLVVDHIKWAKFLNGA